MTTKSKQLESQLTLRIKPSLEHRDKRISLQRLHIHPEEKSGDATTKLSPRKISAQSSPTHELYVRQSPVRQSPRGFSLSDDNNNSAELKHQTQTSDGHAYLKSPEPRLNSADSENSYDYDLNLKGDLYDRDTTSPTYSSRSTLSKTCIVM